MTMIGMSKIKKKNLWDHLNVATFSDGNNSNMKTNNKTTWKSSLGK